MNKVLLMPKHTEDCVQKILIEICDLLNKFKDGRVFNVKIVQSDGNIKRLKITEIGSENILNYVKNVASVCIEYNRYFYIAKIKNKLTYIIY